MNLKDKFVDIFLGAVIESKVKERLRASSTTDEDMTGWRKLTGDVNRNLSPLKQERMIEIGFYLWENTPMGRTIIETTKDFILAEGLPYEAKNENVKTLLDDFWYDPLNRMDLYLEKHVRELLITGELCLPAFVAEQTGKVRLGYVDPAQIKEVVTDPENIKIVIGIILKGSSGEEGRKLKNILPEEADSIISKKAQELRQSYTDGQCFFFTINNLTNSPRGRSELLATADWIDGYEQFLFDLLDKWKLINTFIWDLMVQGANEEEIKKQVNALTKKAGSIYGHNDKVTLEARTPDLKAVDTSEGARLFRNHILSGQGFPKHWFGGGGDVNRATSVEMGTPTFKMLSSKQLYFKYILETIFEFAIDKGLEKKYLRVLEEEAYDYSVITPELSVRDVTKYATMIQQVSASLAIAQNQKWIDQKTCQNIFATVIETIGVEVDLEEMEKNIIDEQIEDENQDYLSASAIRIRRKAMARR